MALSLSPQEIVQLDEYPLLRIAPSWKRVRLGDIANVQNGFPFKSAEFSVESGFPLIRIRDVGRGETQHFYTGEYDEEFVVKCGDILIGMDGDFHAARWKGPDALLNQRVCRLTVESEYYDENFFLTCLQPYLNAVNTETSSVTVKHLSSKTVQDIPLPLPPLNEQRRIVEKIEAMFDEIDKGVESLQTARATLSLFRQSLLKSAFEGRLTGDWRAQNADKLEAPETLLARIQHERDTRYKAALDAWQDALTKWRADGEKGKKPAKPKRQTEFEFQEKETSSPWPTARVEALLRAPLINGRSVKDKPGGFPVLRLTALKKGTIVLSEHKEGNWTEADARPFLVERDDIFLARGNGSKKLVGIGGRVMETPMPVAFPDTMIRLRLDTSAVRLDFFLLAWNSWTVRSQIEDAARTTAGIYKINQDHVSGFTLPLPSLVEQAEIVRLLDQKLEAAYALEAEIETALTRADALRQSILKKAFSGQLVPQDPNDEPATKLLERIKAEKVEREQAAKRDRKSAPTRKPEVRKPTLADLIEVLKKQKDWISAAKAAQELGIGDGSTSDDVEAFYRQLKNFVEDGVIEVERRVDEDWLRLATGEVS